MRRHGITLLNALINLASKSLDFMDSLQQALAA